MKVAVPKETRPGELRVALVPQGVKTLAKAGLEVVVEAGAGRSSAISDEEYVAAGAGKDQVRDLCEGGVMNGRPCRYPARPGRTSCGRRHDKEWE